MGKHHMQLIEDAKAAIDKVFSDTSVPASTTMGSLKELRDEIEAKLEALEADGVSDDL